MVLFLLLVIAAIALGIVGVVVKGLFYLLIIGIVVILVDLVLLGFRMSRNRRRPAAECPAEAPPAFPGAGHALSGAVRPVPRCSGQRPG